MKKYKFNELSTKAQAVAIQEYIDGEDHREPEDRTSWHDAISILMVDLTYNRYTQKGYYIDEEEEVYILGDKYTSEHY